MRFLKTNTATRITVGPFFDKTDGVTPEVALTVTACKLTFTVDDAGVPTLVLDTNPTASGGSNDMVHISGDDAGFYDLELAAANVNYVGRAMLALTDAATHCPVFHEFMILPANVYDSFVGGTDTLQADVTQYGGTNGTFSGGRPEVNTTHAAGTAWNSGAIGASTLASDTITAAKIAADAITAAKIATGAIDADAIADGAIDAGAFASDAITAAKVASDVGTEIAAAVFAKTSALWDSLTYEEVVTIVAAALAGKASGLDVNAPVYRDLSDTQDVITATTDANGNRSAVTLNP